MRPLASRRLTRRQMLAGLGGLAVVGWSPSAPARADEAPIPNVDAPPATILMTEYALGPGETVTSTGPVSLRLVNAGVRRHTLTVLIDAVEHVSPEVRPGDGADWVLVMPRPGRYDVWCNEYRHLEKGMDGVLVAVAPCGS